MVRLILEKKLGGNSNIAKWNGREFFADFFKEKRALAMVATTASPDKRKSIIA